MACRFREKQTTMTYKIYQQARKARQAAEAWGLPCVCIQEVDTKQGVKMAYKAWSSPPPPQSTSPLPSLCSLFLFHNYTKQCHLLHKKSVHTSKPLRTVSPNNLQSSLFLSSQLPVVRVSLKPVIDKACFLILSMQSFFAITPVCNK